jgi:hypothetical protein
MNIDPNLIAVSKDGKYVYPVDSITGSKTFAPIDYFQKMVKSKYGGSVERFVKEYITRETKKYLDSGYTPEQVKEIASKHKDNKLPKIAAKVKKDPRVPKKERKTKQATTAKTTVTLADGTQEVVNVYPWSGNPDYFTSPHTALDIAAVENNTCFMPNIYLDDECYGCPHYDACKCTLKYDLTIKKK